MRIPGRRAWRAVLAGLLLAACSAEDAAAPPPVEVSVITVGDADRNMDLAYSARTRGEREVDVRARVSGILERRFYQEGESVAAGARLFRIDPAPYAAAVRNARARLGVEQARLVQAERQHGRIGALHDRGFVSSRGRDEAEANLHAARSAVAAARAELEKAQLDLGYTDVRAPISGVTGTESRSEGSLVDAASPESSLLTTITQSGALYAEFGMPFDEAQLVRAAHGRGPVHVRLVDEAAGALVAEAPVTFIDSRVDPGTGTVKVRATVGNADARLYPGQFVRAEVAGIAAPRGVYIPARALVQGAREAYVWKIDRQDKAHMAPVTAGQSLGNLVRVEKGIVPGDRVVIEGALKLQPGAAVHAVAFKPTEGAGGQGVR